MLNTEINRRAYRHFLTRSPDDIAKSLNDLFYPDYGLASARKDGTSIAATLQRMHAHLLDVELELIEGTKTDYKSEPLYSVVFYGPPSGGKTTLLKALAKTADVPLVEVTPSDILTQGTDQVERHARSVFEALAMLTDTVIMFDEFDSILFNRDYAQRSKPTNVFQFLTPGMLPKFSKLHDCARKRRVVYALATNYLASLDRAAVRQGRFDLKVGVFPPDVLSRAGRLISQYNRWYLSENDGSEGEKKTKEVASIRDIVNILNGTSRIIMTQAAKKCWFTAPKTGEKLTRNSPFDKLINGKGEIDPQRCEFPRLKIKYCKELGKSISVKDQFLCVCTDEIH